MKSSPSARCWEPQAHRGIVVASRGLVAASQPLAVSAGLRALQCGGSCVDAAIAASAVLAVTEPYNSHLGGDAFVILYDARDGSTVAFNGSGAAPQNADPNAFHGGIPVRGIRAATTPGLVDCWFALYDHLGSLPVHELLRPAIEYAELGFPAGYRFSSVFSFFESGREPWFAEARRALTALETAPVPGAIIRNRDLGWSLRQIGERGRDAFYCGPISERLVRYSRKHGGFFDETDFAEHHTEALTPLRSAYRGLTVHAQPPVSQGLILLEQLNIVEGFDLLSMGFGSPEAVHTMVEAKKLAFEDRERTMGDPRFVDAPTALLTSKEHAASRRDLINPARAMGSITRLDPATDTTYFCIVDESGSAISFIQSVYHAFGCGAVADGTGILLNNRMTGFSLDPASPNVYAPGKRPMHTLNAYIVTEGPRLRYVGGTPGGHVQVQSNLQVITDLVDFGFNVQQAVEAPRWQHVPTGDGRSMVLQCENRLPLMVTDRLKQLGHPVQRIGAWQHGSAYQLIAQNPVTGAYEGASDPRCDGYCAGW